MFPGGSAATSLVDRQVRRSDQDEERAMYQYQPIAGPL
jgi:hypothetical protein